MKSCIHPGCERRKSPKCRGLCVTCWRVPEIRELYPKQTGKHLRNKEERASSGFDHEPTEEELNELIAANYPSMPAGTNLDGQSSRIGKAVISGGMI